MELLNDFQGVRVLVVGDVMLDRYWWGSVTRISPEAPVPVVALDRTTVAAGGAANVAANVAGLGAVPYLIGIVGDDDEAAIVPTVIAAAGISRFKFFPLNGRKTTVKTRIIAHNQQIARLDQETTTELTAEESSDLFTKIKPLFDEIDVVVISDYAKGFLTAELTKSLISLANEQNKPVLIDPKGRDYSKYAGATILTPNRLEAADACGLDHHAPNLVERSGKQLVDDLGLKSLLITLGESGMLLLERGREPEYLSATARNVYDVTGAGDTVIATMAVALAAGSTLIRAAALANLAAGVVVEKIGTTAITIAELLAVAESK